MTVVNYVLMAVMVFLSVPNIARSVRTFAAAKKADILKVWVTPLVIFHAVLCVIWIAVAVNRFSAAADYRAKAEAYESIAGIGGAASSGGYQELAAKISDAQTTIMESANKLYNKRSLCTTPRGICCCSGYSSLRSFSARCGYLPPRA